MYYAPYYIDAPVNLTAHFIVCILNVKVALSPDAPALKSTAPADCGVYGVNWDCA